jgi:hypothetical protein
MIQLITEIISIFVELIQWGVIIYLLMKKR